MVTGTYEELLEYQQLMNDQLDFAAGLPVPAGTWSPRIGPQPGKDHGWHAEEVARKLEEDPRLKALVKWLDHSNPSSEIGERKRLNESYLNSNRDGIHLPSPTDLKGPYNEDAEVARWYKLFMMQQRHDMVKNKGPLGEKPPPPVGSEAKKPAVKRAGQQRRGRNE